MIEYLTVVAGSWPIAVMVVGIGVSVVVRRSLKQAMDNKKEVELDRAKGNHAVVVQNRNHEG